MYPMVKETIVLMVMWVKMFLTMFLFSPPMGEMNAASWNEDGEDNTESSLGV